MLTTIETAFEDGHGKKTSLADVVDVVQSHGQSGDNYPWLAPYFGKLLWVDFKEGKGAPWKTYDVWWWARHGSVVDHRPKNLVKSHVDFFVNPATRAIVLRFYFQSPSGDVYWTHPTRTFYKLEAAYFARHGLCQDKDKAAIRKLHQRDTEGLAPYWSALHLERVGPAPLPSKKKKTKSKPVKFSK